ncbi:MAG: hypothetical protein DHS20C17_24020 [Cyclobacteriaceae bacterium]|nr:MAG: hypothetical protein DHS20C17_24020 [Cyclobacteriaceae bacterium]
MKSIYLLYLFLITPALFAQQQEGAVYQSDTLRDGKKLKIIALPVLFSTPETGFGFGAGAQLFLLRKTNIYNARLSNMFVSAITTSKKQFMFEAKPQIYLERGNYFLDTDLKFRIFPNSFWGIGNNSLEEDKEAYDMTSFELKARFLKRLPPSLNFGFEYVFEHHNVTDVEEGGILDSGTVLGADEATVSGLGVVFNLDSRDIVEAPSSGHFMQLSARFSSEILGASYSFNKFIVDLRTYLAIGTKGVLAFQAYSESTYGEIPFQAMSWFGGGERARGYFRGRFIDNHQYVLQGEYRYKFHPRWTLAGFALVGEVAELPGEFLDDFNPSVGGGIRFKLLKDQNTILRLDIGAGKDDNSGFYFGVNEAF